VAVAVMVHLQRGPVERLIGELEGLLGAALANRDMDLVIAYAGVLDGLHRVREKLRQREAAAVTLRPEKQ